MNADVGSGHEHGEEVSHIENDQQHERDAHHGIQDAHHLTSKGNRIDLPITCNNEREDGHVSNVEQRQRWDFQTSVAQITNMNST